MECFKSFITYSNVISPSGRGLQPLIQDVLQHKSQMQEGFGRIPKTALSKNNTPLNLLLDVFSEYPHPVFTNEDGILLATTTGNISLWENAYMDFLQGKINLMEWNQKFKMQPHGVLLNDFCQKIGFLKSNPHRMVLSSACSAGTQALGVAHMWLKNKKVKRCFVLSVETLTRLTSEGFQSFQLVSPERCRPFDRNRKGINLSEAVGVMVLESEPKSHSCASIIGYGTTSDAYHMTSPEPHGKGSYLSMKMALKSAGLKAKDIPWVHAHGTGSRANDQAESYALAALFKNEENEESLTPPPFVTSTKGIHGHSLAASGLLESALCLEALKMNFVLPTFGFEEQDEGYPHLNLLSKPHEGHLPYVLKNTLGFGGCNASLVMMGSAVEAPIL